MSEFSSSTTRSADYETLLSAAALLVDNGQSTVMTQAAVQRLNRGLGLDAVLIPTWSSLTLTAADSREIVRVAAVSPTAINMRRVASLMAVVDQGPDRRLSSSEVSDAVAAAAAESGSSTAAFAIACATGASALAVIFGATHPLVVALVAAGAIGGGLLRRGLGHLGAGPLLQVFAAATLAGLLGGLAAHLHLGASTVLVAVCQAMILVPGPHILNGAIDLLDLRITLGLARLGYAGLLLASITGGLVLGLTMGGQSLAVTAPPAATPFLVDVIAAGVAAASYAVYFSMPTRIIGWPVAVGMLAHAVHWWAATSGADLAGAAFLSCLLVGALLVPAAHYLRIPFAAVGFASVVALVPGVFVFRALSGLLQLSDNPSPSLLVATVSDQIIAMTTVTGMALGIALPMHFLNLALSRRAQRS